MYRRRRRPSIGIAPVAFGSEKINRSCTILVFDQQVFLLPPIPFGAESPAVLQNFSDLNGRFGGTGGGEAAAHSKRSSVRV